MAVPRKLDSVPHPRWAIRSADGRSWLGCHGVWGPMQHARLWGGLRECTEALGVLLETGNEAIMETVTVYMPQFAKPEPDSEV